MSLKTVRSASHKLKSTVMFVASFALVLGSVGFAAPQFFSQVAHATGSAQTVDATSITATGATLNGTNGDTAADNTSFWWGTSTAAAFAGAADPSSQLGDWSHDAGLGSKVAYASFSNTLTNLTPNTLYHFVAWSLVGGTWLPGNISSFVTAPVGSVFIDANINSTLDAGELTFSTIQAAVTSAQSGDTIHVSAGQYIENGQIIINRNLNIVGADKATTIIKPAQDTGDSSTGNGRGWFLVQPGNNFNISNVTLDGTGQMIYMGLYYWGNGTVNNVNITNIKYNQSSPDYQGRGIIIKGNVNVTNSTFTEMGRIAIQYYGGSGTASGNTMTGKGTGNWLDYGFDIGAGAVVNVLNNTISGDTGTGGGEASAAVMATTYFGGGTHATVTGNTLTNNSIGIAAGYDGTDTAVVVAHNNNISGNTQGLVSTHLTVDATNNWWGDVTGPGDVGPGTGDKVSTNVNYKPWCTDLGCTTFSSADAVTLAATGITSTDATLNGANGSYGATGHSLWVSTAPFVTSSPNIPIGVYSTPDMGSVAANVHFLALLSSLTTNAVTTGGVHSTMPAITSNTTYYYAAWSEVDGTWYPGQVLSFTTARLTAPANLTLKTSPGNITIANDGYTNSYGIVASWDAVVGADHYMYEYWNDISSSPYNSTHPYIVTTSATTLSGVFNQGEGVHHIAVSACDAAGNCSAYSAPFVVTYDKTAPVASVNNPQPVVPIVTTVIPPTANVVTPAPASTEPSCFRCNSSRS